MGLTDVMVTRPAESAFHVLTLGFDRTVIDGLFLPIASKGEIVISHLAHPRCSSADFAGSGAQDQVHYFWDDDSQATLPTSDAELLAELEAKDAPTIHNMILGDRVVSKLDYELALRYATFLAGRIRRIYELLRPSVVVGGFDALHSGLGCAIAKRMGIPWVALHFTAIPPGLVCFCNRLVPAARVQLGRSQTGDKADLLARAEKWLQDFECRRVEALAYVTPRALSIAELWRRIPARFRAIARTMRHARKRERRQLTEEATDYSLLAVLKHFLRVARARTALKRVRAHSFPPRYPYALFGFHMQPESSIDVWAPFFSDQFWVVQAFARSLPPTHRLLVKIHKSDAAKYTAEELAKLRSLPCVELVDPFANTRSFLESASLVFGIQGTMCLEAGLLGKPVIMLGESAYTLLPSVSSIASIAELPALVRKKLAEQRPERRAIIEGYAAYLQPFAPASSNVWNEVRTENEIAGYVSLFRALEVHCTEQRFSNARGAFDE